MDDAAYCVELRGVVWRWVTLDVAFVDPCVVVRLRVPFRDADDVDVAVAVGC